MSIPFGRIAIINDRRIIPSGETIEMSFSIPSGSAVELRELTHHLLRSGGGDSDSILVKGFRLARRGESQTVEVIKGTPNIKELAGNGAFPRLMTVIEILENNETIILSVQNGDSVSVTVSITMFVALQDIVRQIAAQPAQ